MQSDTHTAPVSTTRRWGGWIVSALPILMLLFSGSMKLLPPAPVEAEFARLGYPTHLMLWLGLCEILCTVVYAIPRTAMLGAILLTGYLGGATATHVRLGEPFFFPLLFGVLLWGGLWLRDTRLRALFPLQR